MASEEVGVSIEGHIATVEIRRPPNNFLDAELIAALATAFEDLDRNKDVWSIVLAVVLSRRSRQVGKSSKTW